ncbi:hypothetical protein [Cupriavidus sp. WS]|uniref:hypothetical protein n=1 Tax=Cupriavidus sp. WS TaxID=1312922 RepID=UPI0018CA723D|nr:hypothetical protein [Cupriavidus sp. WS]
MNPTPLSSPAMLPMPTLNLALRLDRGDVFGAIEWTLANARRTGLTLAGMDFDAAAPWALTLSVAAADADLLDLFVRRLGNGVDVLEVREVAAHAPATAPALAAAAPARYPQAANRLPSGTSHAASSSTPLGAALL